MLGLCRLSARTAAPGWPFMMAALLGALLVGPGCGDAAAGTEQQRQLFQSAEKALLKGDRRPLEQARERLASYPLLPMLEYQALKLGLPSASASEVEGFLGLYGDQLAGDLLRDAWLDQLAKQGRWEEFLVFYRPVKSAERRCQRLNALVLTGHGQEAYAELGSLWGAGDPLHGACDEPTDAWRRSGLLTDDLLWKRLGWALTKDKPTLARKLAGYLDPVGQAWALKWIGVHDSPETLLDVQAFAGEHGQREEILLHGLERLARRNLTAAEAAWANLKQVYSFSTSGARRGERTLALAQIKEDRPGILERVAAMEPDAADQLLHQKRTLLAVAHQDWSRVLSFIQAMAPADGNGERWRYWRGRALERLGRVDEARKVFQEMAKDRTYYAFLAAERAGLDYYLENRPLAVEQARMDRLEALASTQAVAEWLALNRKSEARREWRWLTASLERADLEAAAKLAQRWGWPDQAIQSLGKAESWDDLDLRFPLLFRAELTEQADRTGLELSWLFAIVRQESAFADDARSSSGALGLMQLMPATAAELARQTNKKAKFNPDALLSPARNISLGASYLDQLRRKFNSNPVLVTAAYNAGPGRVQRWLPARTLDADIWVETIPFAETQDYVRRVLAYGLIYDQRLGGKPGPLSGRMRPIDAVGGGSGSGETLEPAKED